jgi:hypothetical protein
VNNAWIIWVTAIICVTVFNLKKNRLRDAAIKLRNAQKAYLNDRGNKTLGRMVGEELQLVES